MIIQALPQDREEVQKLFDLCFPGEQQFADWFFRRVWRPEQTWLWRQQETLAMVQLMPLTLKGQGTALEAAYLYALGTHPKARGQGLARQLLEHCQAICKQQGGEALVLIPQQPSLVDYYSRFGYRIAFQVEQTTIEAAQLPQEISLELAQEKDAAQMAALYQKSLQSRLHPARKEQDFLLQLELYQGSVWLVRRQDGLTGWAFLEEAEQGQLRAAEAFGPDGALAVAGALARLGHPSCFCRGFGLAGEQAPIAMALPLTPSAEQALAQGQGYCNLLWN